MKMPLWVKLNGKWEVFPYDKLTQFSDGETGFTYEQLIQPNQEDNLQWKIFRKYAAYFKLEDTKARAILCPEEVPPTPDLQEQRAILARSTLGGWFQTCPRKA